MPDLISIEITKDYAVSLNKPKLHVVIRRRIAIHLAKAE